MEQGWGWEEKGQRGDISICTLAKAAIILGVDLIPAFFILGCFDGFVDGPFNTLLAFWILGLLSSKSVHLH